MTHRNALQTPQTSRGIHTPAPSCDHCTASDSVRSRRGSVLIKGMIPKRTPCPFAEKCHERAAGWCGHHGEAHKVAYYCGLARLFDIFTS